MRIWLGGFCLIFYFLPGADSAQAEGFSSSPVLMSLPHNMGKSRGFQTPFLPVLVLCRGSSLVPQDPTPLGPIWPKPPADTFPILPQQKAQHSYMIIRLHDHSHGARSAPTHRESPWLCLGHCPAKMMHTGCSQWSLGTHICSQGSKSGLKRAVSRASASRGVPVCENRGIPTDAF